MSRSREYVYNNYVKSYKNTYVTNLKCTYRISLSVYKNNLKLE